MGHSRGINRSQKGESRTHDEEEGGEPVQVVDLDLLVQDRPSEFPASQRDEREGDEGGLIAVGEDVK